MIRVGHHHIDGIIGTFSDAVPGQLLVYVGSGDRLEVTVRRGNASAMLDITITADSYRR